MGHFGSIIDEIILINDNRIGNVNNNNDNNYDRL